ncbi:hypothetical protein [Spiroplasma endosymbiont of Panorpa germanica]|uniref:hypothetical protein n=1 Tax=Spiroplasma endosymbiont of Panorpa germanica TaxID=3066314 RepID=UPI0030CDB414
MINFVKPEILSQNEKQKLVHLAPYWEKDVTRISKKLNKWLFKFSAEGKGYLKPINPEENITDQLFYNGVNFSNFYNIKINKIKSNPKVLRKFSKMIAQTTELLALCHAVKIIADFYIKIEKSEVAKKRDLVIEMLNDKNYKVFQACKTEIMANIQDDEYIEIVYKKAIIIEGKIFDSSKITMEILSYLKLLFKKKKMSESNMINCNYSLFFSENFAWNLKKHLTNFISNIY